jgi:hypothetical protein
MHQFQFLLFTSKIYPLHHYEYALINFKDLLLSFKIESHSLRQYYKHFITRFILSFFSTEVNLLFETSLVL